MLWYCNTYVFVLEIIIFQSLIDIVFGEDFSFCLSNLEVCWNSLEQNIWLY